MGPVSAADPSVPERGKRSYYYCTPIMERGKKCLCASSKPQICRPLKVLQKAAQVDECPPQVMEECCQIEERWHMRQRMCHCHPGVHPDAEMVHEV